MTPYTYLHQHMCHCNQLQICNLCQLLATSSFVRKPIKFGTYHLLVIHLHAWYSFVGYQLSLLKSWDIHCKSSNRYKRKKGYFILVCLFFSYTNSGRDTPLGSSIFLGKLVLKKLQHWLTLQMRKRWKKMSTTNL